MPNKPHQNTLHLLHAHIHRRSHGRVEHPCWNVPPATFLLQVIETLEDDTFTRGQTVSNIGEIITKFMGMYQIYSLVAAHQHVCTMPEAAAVLYGLGWCVAARNLSRCCASTRWRLDRNAGV